MRELEARLAPLRKKLHIADGQLEFLTGISERRWWMPDTPVSRGAGNPFRTALVVSLMHPKAILFYISFFIQFVTPGYEHPALSFLILGMIVEIVSLVYLSALIFGGAALAQAFRRHRRMAAVGTGTVGAVFLGFSVKLATATLG